MPFADQMMNSFQNAYNLGKQVGSDKVAAEQAGQIRNVFAETIGKPEEFGGEDAALQAAAHKFGQLGNVNGYQQVLKMAQERNKERAAFMQQVAPKATFLLRANDVDTARTRVKAVLEHARQLGIPNTPEPTYFDNKSIDEIHSYATGFLTNENMLKLQEDMYKEKEYGARTKKEEAQAEAETARKGLYEAQSKWYERRPATTTGRAGDKRMNESQILDIVAAHDRLLSMSEKEKKRMQITNRAGYDRLLQQAEKYDESDPRMKAKKKITSTAGDELDKYLP